MSYYDSERWPGVPSHHIKVAVQNELPVHLESYKDALNWWQRRDPWKGLNDRPAGKRDSSYRRMRLRTDKAIEFEYNGGVICIWHADGSLTVNPKTGYAYGAFNDHVLPRGVDTGLEVNLGQYILLAAHDARETKIKVQREEGGVEAITNPDIKVIRCNNPVTLKRQLDEDHDKEMWLPENIWRVSPFEWFELEKSLLREASLKYNITDFVAAIEAALAMGAEIKTAGSGSRGYNSQVGATLNGENILELLEQERFVEAAQLVRVNQSSTWDPVSKKYSYDTTGLKQGDIKAIRRQAYKELGLYYIESQRIVTLPMLTNISTKIRELGRPKAS